MLKSVLSVSLGLLMVLLLTACYTVTLDAHMADTPIVMNNPSKKKPIKHFRIQATSHHLIIGLIEFSKPDIASEIMKEVHDAGGTAAVNVRIKSEFTFLDYVLNFLTSGIYNPITVIAEGDVISEED